ncbi:capsular polysaccharide biosynthesis protein [Bacteroidia bacterium]|nr:capsular polysaccharide biosynthesis protein [Bacteroidia bacterium]
MNKLKKIIINISCKLDSIPFLPKKLIFALDLFTIAFSFTISYLICFSLIHAPLVFFTFLIKLVCCVAINGFFFYLYRTYSIVVRYSGFRDALSIFIALVCSNLLLLLCNIFINQHYERFILPNVGFFINFVLSFTLLVFSKMLIRVFFDYTKLRSFKQNKHTPVLLYGLSTSNIDLARLINHSEFMKYRVIGFVSMDYKKTDKQVFNMPVYHAKTIFHNTKIRNRYEAIVINPKEIDRKEKQWIAEYSTKYRKKLLITPPLENFSNERARFTMLKKVKIEDLLQRIPIQIDMEKIAQQLQGKIVLITGAAGSIGSEIVRQICNFEVGQLLICDIAESPLHEIGMEVKDKHPNINCKSLIVDVRNYDLVKWIFEIYHPDVIYHAAAYKHVPLMEEYPCEAILTNVMGSKNMADLAAEYNVEAFVMISTDKAVKPSNVMGASKRIAEMYVQSLSNKLKKEKDGLAPRFITTRFGNVLGSNGSVVPRFEKQINGGGPVTITHPDIIRYFMTITEACRLVLDAGNFGKGGEVFVFDMGDPVRIKDMAEEMIRLSGYEPYRDINIIFTGLRPGEKLYEELLYDSENVKPTHNAKIKIGTVIECDYEEVKTDLEQLLAIAKTYNSLETVKQMKRMVPEFISQNSKFEQYDSKTE